MPNLIIGVSGKIQTGDTFDIITSDILGTKDKTLVFDGLIGNKQVKYWIHIVNNITIVGDSLLLHVDPKTGKILEYIKTWSDVSQIITPYKLSYKYQPSNYLWERTILYPNKECSNFYPLYEPIPYPLICLEVRYENGSTYLYDIDGIKIGYEIPAPSVDGFTLSGDCNDDTGDCWSAWRESATAWFSKWCDSIEFKIFPSPTEVSEYITNQDVQFFYELAHGGSTQFQCGRETDTDKYYTSSDCEKDMTERQRMKFTFLGSCDGMTNLNNGTFSDEFRKGKMMGTVIIGYTHMTDYPGPFRDTLPWQNKMFSCMDDGWTIKKSFDEACSYSPGLVNYVVFVGDETLKATENPPCIPDTPSGDTSIKINELTAYITTSYEPDRDNVYFLFDWDDGSNSSWLGPFSPNENCMVSHSWDEAGNYAIKTKAKDVNGLESNDWSSSLLVHVVSDNYPPNTPIITGAGKGKVGVETYYNFMSMDPEGDQMYYFIDWGDNTTSNWLGPFSSGYQITISHTWSTPGIYPVKAKVKDVYDDESDWAMFSVIIPNIDDKPISRFVELLFQRFPYVFPILRHQFEC